MKNIQNVSDVVADVCAENTNTIFGLMGNGNAFFISNLTTRGLDYYSARHEAGTLAMADAYYRASGKVAVATVTYGAGFTNSLTALTESSKARIPMVVVVGDAPASGPRPWDIDQIAVAQGLGVQTITVSRATARSAAEKAWTIAREERNPVILAIPYDLAALDIEPQRPFESSSTHLEQPALDSYAIERSAKLLAAAERPLIIAGNGAVLSEAGTALRELGDKLGALFATSLRARNFFNSPWDLGIAGGFTREKPLALMRSADVVLVVGASLNAFQTRYGSLFHPTASIIRIDEDPQVAHEQATDSIVGHAARVAEYLLDAVPTTPVNSWRSDHPEVADSSIHWEPQAVELAPDGRLNPRAVAQALDSVLPAERTIVQDGGHFCGWAPMYLQAPDPQALMMVGTAFQTIGLGLPSALGAAVARPDRMTVLVSGDGGALMALADLETAARNIASGVMVVFNDAAYGAELHQYAVRGLDDTAMQIEEVDFALVGRAFGASGVKMRTLADIEHLRVWLEQGAKGLFILDVAISQSVVAEYMQESMAPVLASLAQRQRVSTSV
jgi:acetolactate synthase-1/2/3 large subunit